MTANALPEQVRAFRDAGMDDHIAKPFKQHELHNAIRQALNRAAQTGGKAPPQQTFDPSLNYCPAA